MLPFIQKHLHQRRRILLESTLCLALFLSLSPSPGGAVDKGKTSYTAEVVCAFRSIGALDPDPKTRNPDFMAKHFVNPALRSKIPGLGLDFEDAKTAMDLLGNGAFYYVNARTRHIDSLLIAALKAGFRQVVIMGAGFDSRAYRFHETYPEVRFFEIDLPATSADKQHRVEALMGQKPDWVTFVPIDFNTQTLDEVLAKADFAADQQTLYVWEGVTYYISQTGVDHTLRYIAEKSAPGSRIVFDYILEDVVQGMDYSAYGARKAANFVSLVGEPYTFGISPNQLESYINLHGLRLLSDLGPKDLTQRYLVSSNGTVSGKIAGFFRVVHADVPEADEQQRLKRLAELQIKRFKTQHDLSVHKNIVPDDVQTFLNAYSDCFIRKDFDALLAYYAEDFLSDNYTRDQVISFFRMTYLDRPIHQYRIFLTRFDKRGHRAKIDGFIARKGFRTPLMVTQIVQEEDGQWRWYGH